MAQTDDALHVGANEGAVEAGLQRLNVPGKALQLATHNIGETN